jgi:hypothetical protein
MQAYNQGKSFILKRHPFFVENKGMFRNAVIKPLKSLECLTNRLFLLTFTEWCSIVGFVFGQKGLMANLTREGSKYTKLKK